MCLNIFGWMADSLDPDQTALRSSMIWVNTVAQNSYLIAFNTVREMWKILIKANF